MYLLISDNQLFGGPATENSTHFLRPPVTKIPPGHESSVRPLVFRVSRLHARTNLDDDRAGQSQSCRIEKKKRTKPFRGLRTAVRFRDSYSTHFTHQPPRLPRSRQAHFKPLQRGPWDGGIVDRLTKRPASCQPRGAHHGRKRSYSCQRRISTESPADWVSVQGDALPHLTSRWSKVSWIWFSFLFPD